MAKARTKRRPPQPAALPMPAFLPAQEYAVRVERAEVAPGELYWEAVRVRHLPPDENRGRHNVFVDALDEDGNRSGNRDLRIGWTWEGRKADEPADPKPLDKPATEPAGNVDVYRGQYLAVWIQGDDLPSDRVANLHTDHPDEPAANGELWNSRGHHSFHVIFRRTRKGADVVVTGDRFTFQVWPTEQQIITQWFGNAPEEYGKYGLPGHEGIDIAAPAGSNIYCVAPGQVKRVQATEDGGNYGIHVRVQHAAGYETIYAHLSAVHVQEGQNLGAGHILGLAGDTGNSRGAHLHLTLKHGGETHAGYPHNIIDPTPFLTPLLVGTRDSAAYVRDLVVDGTECRAGKRFVQRWTLRNTGTTQWTDGYVLANVGGDGLGAPQQVSVPPTAPGSTADIAVEFSAPLAAGRYRSIWQLRSPTGIPFGDRVWVDIVVAETGTPVGPSSTRILVRAKLGIDANAPIDTRSGAIRAQVADPGLIADTGVGWVRLNFILGPWQSVDDTTKHSGRTWLETYREIVASFRGRGLRIYGLVGHEAVGEDPMDRFRDGQGQVVDDPWIRTYAETFAVVAKHFHRDVEVFETFNEPDNWRQTNIPDWRRHWVDHEWFAMMLQAVHDRVRGDVEIRHITIVSGPLQGLDVNGNGGARYLRATYQAGKRFFGWGSTAPFPFDAIGYHLYIAQRPENSVADVLAQYRAYMDELRGVIRSEEGARKPIYLSEMGWQSTIGTEQQEARLRAGLEEVLRDDSVALGIWFCLQDFAEKFGLYPEDALTPARRKPVFHALHQLCQRNEQVPVAVCAPLPAGLPAPAEAVVAPLPAAAPLVPAAVPESEGILFDRLLAIMDALVASSAADVQLRVLPMIAALDVIYRRYRRQLAALDGQSGDTGVDDAALNAVTEATLNAIHALMDTTAYGDPLIRPDDELDFW